MSIELVIDNREIELIKKLQKNHEITVEQLPIGDIIFRQGEEVILVIERKTVKDLKASICDGRGREQKARLLGSFPKHRIMYLVEGTNLDVPITSKISGMPVSTLVGSMINTQLRDNIRVYKTSGLVETTGFLVKMREKLEKDMDKFFKDEEQKVSASKYASTLKKSKKANMTPQVWFIAQLSLIPQVTEKVASEIVAVYPTIGQLIQEYDRTPEHLREKLLADIKFPLKNGKNRRVGDKMSSRIYKFCYGITEE